MLVARDSDGLRPKPKLSQEALILLPYLPIRPAVTTGRGRRTCPGGRVRNEDDLVLFPLHFRYGSRGR